MSEGTKEQMEMHMPKHGEICWTEVATTNLESAVNFYSELFGWKITKSQNDEVPMDYREFDTGLGYTSGGMFEMKPEFYGGESPPPHFMNYIAVDDVDATAEKIEELGGSIMGEPQDIPKVGRMAVVQDPTGATFSILKLSY